MTFKKMFPIAIVTAATCCFAVSERLVAATATATGTAPTITYTASGTFAATPISGADTLKLGGEAFSVGSSASAATTPFKTGPNWAAFNKLKLNGTVYSGLLGATPVNIVSAQTSLIQAIAPGQYDQFTLQAPVRVVGIALTVKAVIILPLGTITTPLLHPFTTVKLAPGNATLSYSDGTTNTVLAVQTGTLTATIPAGGTAATSPPALHSNGAQAITLHADGSTSVRSVGAGPVDLGGSTDVVTLKFFASGLSNAAEVHVQIAGQDVPVTYVGASGYFPGLDEVMVQVPRSLIGMGVSNVALMADGRPADPIFIHLQ